MLFTAGVGYIDCTSTESIVDATYVCIGSALPASIVVDDVLKSSLTEKPYNWVWDERAMGTHVLKVKMYGESVSEDSMEVAIFNPMPGMKR